MSLAQAVASMYEALGVAPTASQAELVAAHRRLSFELMSGKQGLSREDCDARLKLLDEALGILSDAASRRLHDEQLAAARPDSPVVQAMPASVPLTEEQRALQLAMTAEEIYRANAVAVAERRFPLAAVSETLGTSMRALQIILRILVWLFVAFLVFRMGGCMLASRNAVPPPSLVARAEEKLIIQSYYKQHGVRAASRAEVAALVAEDKRRENERRTEEFEKRKADSEMQRFLSEASANNERLEEEKERAAAEARQEALMRQREAESLRGANR